MPLMQYLNHKVNKINKKKNRLKSTMICDTHHTDNIRSLYSKAQGYILQGYSWVCIFCLEPFNQSV